MLWLFGVLHVKVAGLIYLEPELHNYLRFLRYYSDNFKCLQTLRSAKYGRFSANIFSAYYQMQLHLIFL